MTPLGKCRVLFLLNNVQRQHRHVNGFEPDMRTFTLPFITHFVIYVRQCRIPRYLSGSWYNSHSVMQTVVANVDVPDA